MKATLASLVRAAIGKLALSAREFSADGLALVGPGPLTAVGMRAVRRTLRDLLEAGEVERVRPGVYRVARRVRGKPELQEVMWDILRFRKKVTIEDLVELSGATESYADEWLRNLTGQGIARHAGTRSTWLLIRDPVAMPRNEPKAARLREMRRKKRERAAALCGTRFKAAADLRMEVNSASEDGK